MRSANKTPDEKLKRHREYYKKWIAKPGNKEKVRQWQKKAAAKWKSKPENIEKAKRATANWANKNREYLREWKRQYMRRERSTPDGIAKNRANSKKYQALALKENPDGFRRYHRNRKLTQKYGITADQWDAIFEAQGKCCAICKSPHARWERGHWHTDHDHELNIIRGILCNECNIGIGKFGDNPAMLQLAIEYLQRFRKQD